MKNKVMAFGAVLVILIFIFTPSLSPAENYSTEKGFFSGEGYEDSDGEQWFRIYGVSDNGAVAGLYSGYAADGTYLYDGAWHFDTQTSTLTRIGLFDDEHSDSSGYSEQHFGEMTNSGYVAGYAEAYDNSDNHTGDSWWGYDPNTGITHRMGLYDTAHKDDTGWFWTYMYLINESGYAAGTSEYYNGTSTYLGESSWLYHIPSGTLYPLGYSDAEHTKDNGYRSSEPVGINSSGYTIGYSKRYNVAATHGESGWLFNPATNSHTKIGYYDAEHTRDDGYLSSRPRQITDSGYVSGGSFRYNGASNIGQTAWIYDINDSSTTKVGYYDAEHTSATDYKRSVVKTVSESGYVLGYSFRYNGGASSLGQSTWIYYLQDDSIVKVGLYDAEHTRDIGLIYNEPTYLAESGYAAGKTQRYNGGASLLGNSAWVYDKPRNVTVKIGYTDAEHTSGTGQRYSTLTALTSSGYVSGNSTRYNGGASALGYTTWVYDTPGSTLHETGIYDAEHTDASGKQYSYNYDLTESGYVSGYSNRYNGGAASLGQTAWLYHVPTSTQVEFDFGEDGTGKGWSKPKILKEDGTLYGVFGHLDDTNTIDGERIFRGTIAEGGIDIFEEVGGEILNYHFSQNTVNVFVSDSGVVAGTGRLWTNYHPAANYISFLLVPESFYFQEVAETKNQKALAKALDTPNSYVGGYAVLMQYLLQYVSGQDASRILQQLLPQASNYAQNTSTSNIRLLLDTLTKNNFTALGKSGTQLNTLLAKLNAPTSGLEDPEYSLYGKYIYSKGSQNGDAENYGYKFNTSGIAFGVDRICGDSGLTGFAVGLIDSDIKGEFETGDIEQTSVSPITYLALTKGKWKMNAGAGYGFLQNESKRYSGIPELGKLKSDWNSHTGILYTNANYLLKEYKDIKIEGIIGADYMVLHEEAHSEKQADLWNLEMDSNTSQSLRSKLGLRFSNSTKFKNGIKLNTELRQIWLHNFLDEAASVTANLNGSSSFNVEGLTPDKDKFQLGATFDLEVSDYLTVFFIYDTQLSENSDLHEFNLGVKYKI